MSIDLEKLTDRELLELAAKAAGIVGAYIEFYDGDYYYQGSSTGILTHDANGNEYVWNPLDNDGDALRLAVKLKIATDYYREEPPGVVQATMYFDADWTEGGTFTESLRGDEFAATRRAIVHAAAVISMQGA